MLDEELTLEKFWKWGKLCQVQQKNPYYQLTLDFLGLYII